MGGSPPSFIPDKPKSFIPDAQARADPSPTLAQRMAQRDPSLLRQVGEFLQKPLVSAETIQKLPLAERYNLKDVHAQIDWWERQRDMAIREGDAETARRYDLRAKNLRGLTEQVAGFTSPGSLATLGGLGLLGRAKSVPTAMKAVGVALPSAGFMAGGVEEATRPPEAQETHADILQRQLGGSAQAILGGIGLKAGLEPSTVRLRDLIYRAGQGFVNEGAARAELDNFLHERALGTQAHVKHVEKTVHDEAQNIMRAVATNVDRTSPAGAIDPAPILSDVAKIDADIVKIPERYPASMQKLATVLQRPGPKGFEEIKQLRTEIGNDIFGRPLSGYPGTVKSVMRRTYNVLSRNLEAAADTAGQGKAWQEANRRWTQYVEDFRESPVRKILDGEDAERIMNPLTGPDAMRVKKTLAKYSNYGLEVPTVLQEAKLQRIAEIATQLARPTRWEMLAAFFTRGSSLLPILPGRVLQKPSVLTRVSRPSTREIRAVSAGVEPETRMKAPEILPLPTQPSLAPRKLPPLPPVAPYTPSPESAAPTAPTPEIPPPPTFPGLETSSQIVGRLRRLRTKLSKGGFTPEENQALVEIQAKTGLDINDPKNRPEIRRFIQQRIDELEGPAKRGKGRKKPPEGGAPPPAPVAQGGPIPPPPTTPAAAKPPGEGGAEFARTPEGMVKLGADPEALGAVLGSSLYAERSSGVIAKELLQNAYDAIRGVPGGQVSAGIGTVEMRPGEYRNYIEVADTGQGMTRQEVETVFTDLGSSGKRGQATAAGGFGIAKAAPLLMGERIAVDTVAADPTQGGRIMRTTFEATPEQVLRTGFRPVTRPVGIAWRTGTRIRVYLPQEMSRWKAKEFIEKSTHSIKPPGELFLGEGFDKPLQPPQTEPIGQIAIPGSEADLYSSREHSPIHEAFSSIPVEIHNNGIYQFTHSIYTGTQVRGMPKRVIIDLRPTVPEGHPQYPFLANRESLSDPAQNALNRQIQETVINPALQRSRETIADAYRNLPRFPGMAKEIVFYDVGGRMTSAEMMEFLEHPRVRNLAATVDRVAIMAKDAINASMPGTQIGKKLERTGIVLSKDVYGVNIKSPAGERTTVLINPFADIERNPNPWSSAAAIWQTTLHELIHDEVPGHYERFTTAEHEVSRATGNVFLQAVQILYTVLRGPNDTIHPEFDRPLQIYRDSRGRPEVTPDIFGGEKGRTRRP